MISQQEFFSDQQDLNGAVGRSALFHGSQPPSLHLTSSLLISFTPSFEARSRPIYKILKLSPSESIVEQRNSKVITYSKSTYIAQLLEKASQLRPHYSTESDCLKLAAENMPSYHVSQGPRPERFKPSECRL